ncbi:hypothetical protein NIIDMKKI_72370 [Mycobacterium kansasii]|uniref:Uncharacterized protein n=1 Tax=Mycobacterium kansasii TaxID=1768 RepID=A0A7G1IM46_MYCKA|nr:hypothetical protein NIIDMKKI_72370 [Mycobacterium kansasii]
MDPVAQRGDRLRPVGAGREYAESVGDAAAAQAGDRQAHDQLLGEMQFGEVTTARFGDDAQRRRGEGSRLVPVLIQALIAVSKSW